jgi:hypothetical protein
MKANCLPRGNFTSPLPFEPAAGEGEGEGGGWSRPRRWGNRARCRGGRGREKAGPGLDGGGSRLGGVHGTVRYDANVTMAWTGTY